MRIAKEVAIYKPGNKLSSDFESVDPLILYFLASRTMGNKSLLFNPPFYGIFVIAAQTDLDKQ